MVSGQLMMMTHDDDTHRWGTQEDRLLVVGAHWDTVPGSGGLDDNGSGELMWIMQTPTIIPTLSDVRGGRAAGAGPGPAPGELRPRADHRDRCLRPGGDRQRGQSAVHTGRLTQLSVSHIVKCQSFVVGVPAAPPADQAWPPGAGAEVTVCRGHHHGLPPGVRHGGGISGEKRG